MQDFRNLEVWRKAHELVLAVYRATVAFPKTEMYGLASQVRRSSVSIPANLAEGCCRVSDSDFARFVQIALGSASETQYHLLLARDLDYLKELQYESMHHQTEEIKRMLSALMKTLRK